LFKQRYSLSAADSHDRWQRSQAVDCASLTPVMTESGLLIWGRTLYGGTSQTTSKTPTDSGGVIFTFNPQTEMYKLVHSFEGGQYDGYQPHHDQMRQVGNVLYGATLSGGGSSIGDSGLGVVFSIKTTGTNKLTVLHTFMGGANDGAMPHSNPMPDKSGKHLYGLTSEGGANTTPVSAGDGTIYEISHPGTSASRESPATATTGSTMSSSRTGKSTA
jgi:hypothetical protein